MNFVIYKQDTADFAVNLDNITTLMYENGVMNIKMVDGQTFSPSEEGAQKILARIRTANIKLS
jgi:hypothetical protein